MPANRAPFARRAAGGRVSTAADEARQSLKRRFVVALMLATAIIVIELLLLRPRVQAAATGPATDQPPLDVPAFVLPARPPSDILIGARIRIG
jgi:hypothetical protein